MKKIVYLFACLVVVMSLASCGKKQQKPEKSIIDEIVESDPRYSSSMVRTADDTTAVMQLATQYLDLLSRNEINSAIDLLYELNSDSLSVLSDKRREELINFYSTFPVIRYNIESYAIFTETNTEVRFTYNFLENKDDDKIPNVMRGCLCPVRFNGNWYLTVPKVQHSK